MSAVPCPLDLAILGTELACIDKFSVSGVIVASLGTNPDQIKCFIEGKIPVLLIEADAEHILEKRAAYPQVPPDYLQCVQGRLSDEKLTSFYTMQHLRASFANMLVIRYPTEELKILRAISESVMQHILYVSVNDGLDDVYEELCALGFVQVQPHFFQRKSTIPVKSIPVVEVIAAAPVVVPAPVLVPAPVVVPAPVLVPAKQLPIMTIVAPMADAAEAAFFKGIAQLQNEMSATLYTLANQFHASRLG